MGIFSNYCGLGGSGPVQHAVDALCRTHDRRYGQLEKKGINPYWTWNEADEEFLEGLRHIEDKSVKEFVTRIGSMTYAHAKRTLNLEFGGRHRKQQQEWEHSKEFQKELKINSGKRLWESDINPIFRCLEGNYLGVDSPRLQTAFFDIEVDFDPERGFSKPEDPFNPVTAISLYLDWLDKLVTLVVPPKSYSWATAEEICNKHDNCYLFEREEDMLNTFLDLIEDADILSGWNSEGFDIPYTVMRITRVLSKDDTRRFCLWGQLPKQRTFERFGAENLTSLS